MNLEVSEIRRLRKVMMALTLAAGVAALACALAYFKFGQEWAAVGFSVALVAGFLAQLWFIWRLWGRNRGA